MQHLHNLIDEGFWPTQKEMSAQLKIAEQTICRWKRQPKFHYWVSRLRLVEQTPMDLLFDRRLTVQAAKTMNPKLVEAHLRRRGLWDQKQAGGGDEGGGGTGGVQVGVTFVGLPQPPTNATAAKMLPPPGATYVVGPDGKRVD